MNKITILTAMSIDGFYVPQKIQKLFGFNTSQYEEVCRDMDAVLTNQSEYKNVREIELDCGKPVYVIRKDRSIVLPGSTTENRLLTIGELHNEGKKNIVIIGNNSELVNILLNKACVDEIVTCLFPVILGKGKRAFSALPGYSVWKVKSRQLYDAGITAIQYYIENKQRYVKTK